jgi:hypothetical protein
MNNIYQKLIETGQFTKLTEEQLLAVTWWIDLGMKKNDEKLEELLDCAILYYSDKEYPEMIESLISHIYCQEERKRDFKAMCLLYP